MKRTMLSFGWNYDLQAGYIRNRLAFWREPRTTQLEMIDAAITELARIKDLLEQPASCAAHKQALFDLATSDQEFESRATS